MAGNTKNLGQVAGSTYWYHPAREYRIDLV